MHLSRLLAYARGDEATDLVLRGGRLLNVLSGEIHAADVAIAGDRIAGVGEGYRGRRELDVSGRLVAPGLIDAHVHIESSLVPPSEFARAVLPRGVTTVVTDPHEIANVFGLEGIRFMLEDAARVPLSIFVNAPSCVPATELETSGAALGAADLASLLSEDRVLGLAEVMNFSGVVAGDAEILAKLEAFGGRILDGHCPGLSGPSLNAYLAAGISSDHECTTAEEAARKLRLGMKIFAREASNAHNLDALLPLLGPLTERRICFCTDDRYPADLLDEGSVDHMVRRAIASGTDPLVALRAATLNPAEHYRLDDRGAIAPGRRADLVIFRDLDGFEAEAVYVAGELVAEAGRPLFPPSPSPPPRGRQRLPIDWGRVNFRIPAAGRTVRVIGIVPDQLVTESLALPARIEAGEAVSDPTRDLLKIAVVERHQGTGAVGLGFVQGLGLSRGALAGTVAHDHHNLVVVGADDRSMQTAAQGVAEAGGGMAAAAGRELLSLLPLPIGGLMSDRPIEEVRHGMDALLKTAGGLGSPLRNPFMAMSFLGLEVIPALKLTDRGLVDVDRLEIVPLFTDG